MACNAALFQQLISRNILTSRRIFLTGDIHIISLKATSNINFNISVINNENIKTKQTSDIWAIIAQNWVLKCYEVTYTSQNEQPY
jgi:hypothetical protein